MGRKIATIGITINLENYENLRLEVQGEVGADGDTEDLIAFLDGMLVRLGHGDEATGELVDVYRRRVLALPGTGAVPPAQARPSPARKAEGQAAQAAQAAPAVQPAAPRQVAAPPQAAEPVQKPRQQAEAPQEAQPPREEPATVRIPPEGKAVAKPAARPVAARPEGAAPPAQAPVQKKGPAPQPAGEAPKEPAAKERAPSAGKPQIAEGEVACEGCGASITRNQEKLSKLLTGKSLCKRCMNP
jgi:hypothetical protein